MDQAQWTDQIKKDIAANRIFVYAKGEKNMAMCGFSNRVMDMFNKLGAPYEVRSIFADPELRPALCAFTNWPTTPQVFVDGNFIGGCDIVTEMFQNGDLQKLIEQPAPAES
jgi:monothiol glutaredoxin